MPNPFVGYVRDPATEPAVSEQDVQSAIAQAAAKYGIPVSILQGIRRQEAGPASAAQTVGFNYAGYGGYFGLPKSWLGSLGEQADRAAATLANLYSLDGSWSRSVAAYTGGGYTLDAADQADASGIGVTAPSTAEKAAGAVSSGLGNVLKGSLLDPDRWATFGWELAASAVAVAFILWGTMSLTRGAAHT